MSVNSGLKATKIIGQRKAFYRHRIPESSCATKLQEKEAQKRLSHIGNLFRKNLQFKGVC